MKCPAGKIHSGKVSSFSVKCYPCSKPELFEPNAKRSACIPKFKGKRTPVIISPGFLGSKIEVELHQSKAQAKNSKCRAERSFYQIWPPTSIQSIGCFVEAMTLTVGEDGLTSRPRPGMTARTVDFGGFSGFTDSLLIYGNLVETLEDLGWKKKKDLFGAPIDWRYAPIEEMQPVFYANLTALVESAYSTNAGTRVSLVGHSFGGNVVYEFLTKKSKWWKEKYIQNMILVGAPLGGSIGTATSTASGYALGAPLPDFITHRILYPVQSNAPSGPYLMPIPGGAHPKQDAVVKTPSRSYAATIPDYMEMMNDLGNNLTDIFKLIAERSSIWNGFPFPQVRTHIMVSFSPGKKDTEIVAIYDEDFVPGRVPATPSSMISSIGDETVPLESLQRYKSWSKEQLGGDTIVKESIYENLDHVSMISDDKLIGDMVRDFYV